MQDSVLGHEDIGLIPEATIECRRDVGIDEAWADPSDAGRRRPPGYTLVRVVQPNPLHMYQSAVPHHLAESSLLARWMQHLIDEGCYVFLDMGGILSVYTREPGHDVSADIKAWLAALDDVDQEQAP